MIAFFGEIDLRLIRSANGRVPTKGGRVSWSVLTETEPHVVWRGCTIYLERDGETDLASIPRVFWSFAPPDGAWLEPAVYHDALFRRRGDVARLNHPDPFTFSESNRLFRDGMKHVGVSALKRRLIYAAVSSPVARAAWGT